MLWPARIHSDSRRHNPVRTTRGVEIAARDLWLSVKGGRNVLRGVSLTIRPRELVAVVGGSGAGKTTLLEALAGVRPAQRGSVRFNGVDLYGNLDTFRRLLGYVPQDDIIHADLPLERTLRYAARAAAAAVDLGGRGGRGRGAGARLARPHRARRCPGGRPLRRSAQAREHRGRAAHEPATSSSSTSRPPAWIPRARASCSRSCAGSRTAAPRWCSPRTRCRTCSPATASCSSRATGTSRSTGRSRRRSRTSGWSAIEEIYGLLEWESTPEAWAQRFTSTGPTARTPRLDGAVQAPAPRERIGFWAEWSVLTRRTLETLVRNRLTLAILLGSPALIVAMFAVLFRPGAFDFHHRSRARSR